MSKLLREKTLTFNPKNETKWIKVVNEKNKVIYEGNSEEKLWQLFNDFQFKLMYNHED